MTRKVVDFTICLTAALLSTSALAADRYDFIFTDANYSNPEQSELDYTSFIGDRQSGAIYSCVGKILLERKTGDVDSAHSTRSCKDAYAPPSGSPPGEYIFSRISALDATSKPNAPKMNPAWGFWRIDQDNHLFSFCGRFGVAAVWRCLETQLPK